MLTFSSNFLSIYFAVYLLSIYLSRDGTRKKATEYRDCFLGKVKGNALVTNPTFSRYVVLSKK